MKDKKRILKEDLEGLKFLFSKYTKEKKFEKATSILQEIDEIKKKLKECK